jgi:hypothetical protein
MADRAPPVTSPDSSPDTSASGGATRAKVCPAGSDVATKDLASPVLKPFKRSMLVSCRSSGVVDGSSGAS